VPNQPQDDQPEVTFKFEAFDGLTNTVDRERMKPRDLARALDIDLDDVGQPHRRRGQQTMISGRFHSLWNANDGTVYGVQNGVLGIIRPDFSFSSLNCTVGEQPVYGPPANPYVQIGDDIYWSAPYRSGIIRHRLGLVDPWGPTQDIFLSPVIDPTATLPAIAGRLLGAPPTARFLVAFFGRIYMAYGNLLWATEYFLPNYVDKTRNWFQFEGEITMLGAVTDGLYVGTTEGLYFMGGTRLEEMKRIRVMDSGVIPGSATVIPSELANPPQTGPGVDTPLEVSIGFMTTRGFCVAEDSGKTTNLTEGKMFFPVANRAAAFFRRQDGMNQYVVVADSGGDPMNGARFGPYVDPMIKRGRTQWVDVSDTATAGDN
jgi:hypothetical protein